MMYRQILLSDILSIKSHIPLSDDSWILVYGNSTLYSGL